MVHRIKGFGSGSQAIRLGSEISGLGLTEKAISQFEIKKMILGSWIKLLRFGIRDKHFRLKFVITICSCMPCHDPINSNVIYLLVLYSYILYVIFYILLVM